jgi:hypothetical protein
MPLIYSMWIRCHKLDQCHWDNSYACTKSTVVKYNNVSQATIVHQGFQATTRERIEWCEVLVAIPSHGVAYWSDEKCHMALDAHQQTDSQTNAFFFIHCSALVGPVFLHNCSPPGDHAVKLLMQWSSCHIFNFSSTSFIHQWLYSFVGPWPLLQFRNLFTQSVGLLGRVISPSQGPYLHARRHTQDERAQSHKYLEWDSNPRSQQSRERR